MSTEHTPMSDKDLWQRIAADGPVAPMAVSDLDFAAWLEGRLTDTEAARVEAAVAANPEMRRAALDLADILGAPLPAAPARLTVRAQALVGFEVEKPARPSWLAALFPFFGGGFSLERGALAGFAVMVAAVGFMLGGGLSESYVHRNSTARTSATAQLSNPLGLDTTNDLSDLFADNS